MFLKWGHLTRCSFKDIASKPKIHIWTLTSRGFGFVPLGGQKIIKNHLSKIKKKKFFRKKYFFFFCFKIILKSFFHLFEGHFFFSICHLYFMWGVHFQIFYDFLFLKSAKKFVPLGGQNQKSWKKKKNERFFQIFLIFVYVVTRALRSPYNFWKIRPSPPRTHHIFTHQPPKNEKFENFIFWSKNGDI